MNSEHIISWSIDLILLIVFTFIGCININRTIYSSIYKENKSAIYIQKIYRGSIQRQRLLKQKIMDGYPVDLELKMFNNTYYEYINMSILKIGYFKYFETIINKGYFNLYNIKIVKLHKIKYLTLNLESKIDLFDIQSFSNFINNIGLIHQDDDWVGIDTCSSFFIMNIKKACDYYCYEGIIIQEELNKYYNIYFNKVSLDIINIVILKIIELNKYQHDIPVSTQKLMRINNQFHYKNSNYIAIVFCETIKLVLIDLYKKEDDVINNPLRYIFDYLNTKDNAIKEDFDIKLKTLYVPDII
jgi:hypothetical protein